MNPQLSHFDFILSQPENRFPSLHIGHFNATALENAVLTESGGDPICGGV